jgi:hypothetical protein
MARTSGNAVLRLGLVAAVVLSSCGGPDPATEPDWDFPAALALQMPITADPVLAGRSIRVTGTRQALTDPAYGCASAVSVCFDVDLAGNLYAPGLRDPVLTNLCPSRNLLRANWVFEYQLFAEPGCTGEQLNDDLDDPEDATCYDSADLDERAHPNQSVLWLEPGWTAREIVCFLRGDPEQWEGGACVDVSTARDKAVKTSERDCGCTLQGGACSCPEGFVYELPSRCTLLPEYDCHVLCWGPEGSRQASLRLTLGDHGQALLTSPLRRTATSSLDLGEGTHAIDIEFSYGKSEKLTVRIGGKKTTEIKLDNNEIAEMEKFNSIRFVIPDRTALEVLEVGGTVPLPRPILSGPDVVAYRMPTVTIDTRLRLIVPRDPSGEFEVVFGVNLGP